MPEENMVMKVAVSGVMTEFCSDLHCVARLLGKPSACMAAPEVLDVVRIAMGQLVNRADRLLMDVERLEATQKASAVP